MKIILITIALLSLFSFIVLIIFKKRMRVNLKTQKLLPQHEAESTVYNIKEIDSVESLFQKASKIKSSNIDSAIDLIKKAILISESKNITLYFKLANYYHYSGKTEDAYTIYNNLINELNIDNVFEYNKTKAQILEKKCILNYKTEQYENYLFNYCYYLFNKIIGHACQGETVEVKEIIYNKNKLNYLSQSKINGCFKKLKIENFQRQFNLKLCEYFNSIQDDLLLMSKLSRNIQKKDTDIKIVEEALRQNEEFMTVYSKLNSNSFIEFYKNNILMDGNSETKF